MTLHCLHGFLGSPHDWDGLGAALAADVPGLAAPSAIIKADLFGAEAFPDAASIPAWADAYRRHRSGAAGRCLLGYSLGGRLALHLATRFPTLWDSVIIVGANPGLDSEEARLRRRQSDEAWARRFETEPWEPLLAAWDAQPVFAGRRAAQPERREQDFSRARLADALRRWSVGAQTPLWPALPGITCPLLWIAGAQDAGQVPICRRVRETIPQAEVWIAPAAGHRVPWEQPGLFTARVAEFLRKQQMRRQQ